MGLVERLRGRLPAIYDRTWEWPWVGELRVRLVSPGYGALLREASRALDEERWEDFERVVARLEPNDEATVRMTTLAAFVRGEP